MDVERAIVIDYTNYRGERAMRRIVPGHIWFGDDRWHPETQWLLEAFDLDKQEYRTFAMVSIHGFHPDAGADARASVPGR